MFFLCCVSSKSSITFSHGAQRMAFSGRARWLGRGHWAISPVATCSPQSRSSAESAAFSSQPKQSPVVETAGTRPFGDPQVRVTAAQERVAKLEAALAVLHGVDGPEVESLRVVVGETRRGRKFQQHHGPRSSTVATRSCSWNDAIDGHEHCELRSTHGSRGARVRVAPGPSPDATPGGGKVCWWTVKHVRWTSTLKNPDNDSLSAAEESASKCFRTTKFHPRSKPAPERCVVHF